MANFIQPKPTEVIAAIEALGFKVERAGDGWRAQCPAHDGTGLNLAIDPGRNGAALVTCHSRGCEYRAVVAALGLSDETPHEPPPRRERTRTPGQAAIGRKVAEYRYCSPDGAHAYSKQRFEPKDFRFVQPNGRFGLPPGCKRWPYRVERWIEAPESAELWIVEGERDTHTMERLGRYATCNDGGAGNWQRSPDFNQLFTGFAVKILPDNDAAGLAHAEDVARKLAGWPCSITMLQPPPNGAKDVTDFIEIAS